MPEPSGPQPPYLNSVLQGDKAHFFFAAGMGEKSRIGLAAARAGVKTVPVVSDSPALPDKKDVANELLAKGTVFVHLDPRDDMVVVPEWLKGQPQLVLQVGLNMPIPILDLRVDGDGLFGTLSFNRQPFTCMVPWTTVFAVVGDDGRGMVWPESMPPEIAAEVDREAARNHVPIPSKSTASTASTASRTAGRLNTEDSSPALRLAETPPPPTIRGSKRPMPVSTDAELPEGSFRMRSRPPQAPDSNAGPSMAEVNEVNEMNEADAGPRPSSRPSGRPSSRPRGPLQLPPYMRVVK